MAIPPIGAHIWGEDPLAEAEEIGAERVQLFLSNPQGWEKPPPRDDAEELKAADLGIYVHAPYLINVCSPKPNIRYGSRKILKQTCEAAAEIGALAVVVHPGPRGGRDRRGRQPLDADARAGRVRGADLPREHGGRRQRRGAPVRRAREALGRGRPGQDRERDRLLLRHLPRPRGGRGPVGRRRAGDRDHRRHRPHARERLARQGGHGRRPPHDDRRGSHRPRRPPPHDRRGERAHGGRDASRGREAQGRHGLRARERSGRAG